MTGQYISISVWQKRPVEDELLQRIERLQSAVNSMMKTEQNQSSVIDRLRFILDKLTTKSSVFLIQELDKVARETMVSSKKKG
jgi:hypothetical protein